MENMGEDWKVYVNEQNGGGQSKEKRTVLCSDKAHPIILKSLVLDGNGDWNFIKTFHCLCK